MAMRLSWCLSRASGGPPFPSLQEHVMNLRFVLAATAVAALAGCASYNAGPTATAQLQPTRATTPPQAPCSLRKRVMW